jgi:tellurite resistance protein
MPRERVVSAEASDFEALPNVLERRGLITRGEVREEIRRLKRQTEKGR